MPGFFDHLQPSSAAAAALDEAASPWQVRVVHAAVKGRARFEVKGLYRCEPARIRIESALARHAGVRQASANILTGRLLIVFDPAREVEEIAVLVERVLAEPTPIASKQPAAFHGAGPAPVQEASDWHVLPANAVLADLETSSQCGLSQDSVQQKLRRFGANSLPRPPPRSGLNIFLGQFKSLPVALLGVSAMLSVATGGLADAVVILGVVLINAGTGYIAESQAERTINALGEAVFQNAMVIRDGKLGEVGAEALVPGDILVLTPGTRVAADARLLESRNLMVDESALTGESLPVTKAVEPLEKPDISLGDRVNMVYMGTVVTGGSGVAVVVATGRYTEMGAVQVLMGDTRPPETPMQRQLGTLGNQMVLLSGSICGIMFAIGLARGYGWLQMLKTSISLAVAAIPEACLRWRPPPLR